jgi:hypothetical protein
MAMKRGYTAMEYKSTIRKLRAVRPGISLSSDFIVGFPGETEDDFAAHDEADRRRRLRRLVQLHLQPAPGTPAANLPDDTPQELKLQRLQQLQAAARAQRARISASAWARCSASWSKARRARMPRRADGPHRMQPHRQLRRRPQAPAGRPDDRRAITEACRIRCAARRRGGRARRPLTQRRPDPKPSHHSVTRTSQHHQPVGGHAAVPAEQHQSPATVTAIAAPARQAPAGARKRPRGPPPDQLGAASRQRAEQGADGKQVDRCQKKSSGP